MKEGGADKHEWARTIQEGSLDKKAAILGTVGRAAQVSGPSQRSEVFMTMSLGFRQDWLRFLTRRSEQGTAAQANLGLSGPTLCLPCLLA